MARDTEKRRTELREKLVDIAEREIRDNGLTSLRARALAEEAGCAVGAIYNVFDDMTGLCLAVNGRTFKRLGEQVSNAIKDKSDAPPVDRLVLIAKGYLAFAAENPKLWHAVFNVEMTADSDVPEWYLAEMGRLFQIITQPLAELDPSASPEDLDLRTRALFSSVHGVVLLGLEKRISGVPRERIEGMIEYLLKSFTAGQA